MAERRRQRKLSCQLHSSADRHGAQKLAQVYRWLVPEPEEPPTEKTTLTISKNEESSSHLR